MISHGVMMEIVATEAAEAAAGSLQPLVSRQKEWRCFHCDKVFTDELKAKEHFGDMNFVAGAVAWDEPACQIDPREYRRMNAELARYRDEDSDLHRQLAALRCQHQTELMRAEEAGYARGLRDGRALAANEKVEP